MKYKLPPLPTFEEWCRIISPSEPGTQIASVENFVKAYAIAAIEAQGMPDGWQQSQADAYVKICESLESSGFGLLSRNPTEQQVESICSALLSMLASAPPAPMAEIVEATQPHPTNNYLFKLLCEKAGIVLGVDRVDTACEKVARMSPCVDSKCPNYWDDAYDDLKPGDIETDCEPAPQEVVEHLAPAPQDEKTHVLVPLRMTKAMREVVDTEDWSWAELLAAAEAVTEDEYAIAEQASVVQQVAWLYTSPAGHKQAFTGEPKERFRAECVPLYTHPAQQAKPPEWYAIWIRNNYQDHPNIQSLCDALIAAANAP